MKPTLPSAQLAPALLDLSQSLAEASESDAPYDGCDEPATDDASYTWPASWESRFQNETAAYMPLPAEKMRATPLISHFGRTLNHLGITSSLFNLSIYTKALQIRGRRIALGLSGILIDCREISRTSHTIVQHVRLKHGVQAMLHGLKMGNALTLYTHEPAIRIARMFERFQILQDIFMDPTWSGEPVTSDEELLAYGNVVCFENQLSVITDLLNKYMEGKTLLGWESTVLRNLRLNSNDMVRLAHLRSTHIAVALRQFAFDTVVSSHRAWKTADKEDGAPMLMIRTKEYGASDISIPCLVEALQDERPRRTDRILSDPRRNDRNMSPQEVVNLPLNYLAPEVGEFKAAVMRYAHRSGTRIRAQKPEALEQNLDSSTSEVSPDRSRTLRSG